MEYGYMEYGMDIFQLDLGFKLWAALGLLKCKLLDKK
jgi:hypothetical protein